ncbi:MAG: tetratricopeptide repeat protein [Deltaproteobacteria bacterium]|nr:MAG: tetratricopeptide repeat protein [Deltaproteobacteria bacterium]
MSLRHTVTLAALASLALLSGPISMARADAPAPISEAGKHFQRGVQLYGEADYHAALVEFRRAYELAPNPTVLYNIGQTYYQLQNYAAALVALQRYLNEAGASALHRREIEQTIDTLQTRVGKIALSGGPPGLDITVDDELIGKTPLDEPILVSIGRRKVTALRAGRPVDNRVVEVAAGDTVRLVLSVGDDVPPPLSAPGTAPPKPSGRSAITTGWIITGSLGAVALGTGVAAYLESRSLKNARDSVPASRSDLDSKSTLVKGLSLAADISGVLALVAGGITLKYSLSQSSTSETHVAISPTGVHIAGSF